MCQKFAKMSGLLLLSLAGIIIFRSLGFSASLVFDKKGYVDCGDIFNVSKGTIEFWIKPASTQNNEWIISKTKDKLNNMVCGFGRQMIMFTVRRGGEDQYVYPSGIIPLVGQWSHVAWTFEGDKVEVFINGQRLRHQGSDSAGNYGLDHLGGGKLFLGRGAAEKEQFNGLLAEVRLSDNIRYTGSFTPSKTPLSTDANTIALWHFNDDGATIQDASGRGHTGKIIGIVGRSPETPGTPALTKQVAAPLPVKSPGTEPAKVSAPVPVSLPSATFGSKSTRAAIRADGTLMLNDKPVFPVGIRTEMLDSLKPIAEAGANLVLGSGEWGPAHYKTAQENNLFVLGGFYEWATFASFRTEGAGINLRTTEEAGIQTVLKEARDQGGRRLLDALAEFDGLPPVIGWNTNEEPEAKLTEVAEYGYEIFKSYNPRHIVVALSDAPRWFHLWKNTADVLIVDNYPFRGENPRNKRPLLETCEYIRDACEAMQGKAVWLMPQLIAPSYWSQNPEDEISLGDMRLQNYLGLIGGAKGIVMFHWGSLLYAYQSGGKVPVSADVFARRLEIVSSVVKEMRALSAVICDGRPTRDLELVWIEPGAQGPGPQMTRELDYYGTKYLLVSNVLDVPIQGKVFGINGGNRRGYNASVFLGQGDISVTQIQPGESLITIGPRGSGVLVFERRPITLN